MDTLPEGEHGGDRPKPEHDTFDEFMEMERARIQEHASGKMARALGYALTGESQEELDRIAAEDQSRAQQGIDKVKLGDSVHYKYIGELTREDRAARIAASQRTRLSQVRSCMLDRGYAEFLRISARRSSQESFYEVE